jgi:hypothetical protein
MSVQSDIARSIAERLGREKERLTDAFAASGGLWTRCVAMDDLLPADLAARFYPCFPSKGAMQRLATFRERKRAFRQLDQVPPLLRDVTFAIQDPAVVRIVEEITGLASLLPDPRLYAGGITLMEKGDYLNPHIDNSHDADRRLYRTLNVLYYVTPGWRAEYGGNLELWDEEVTRPVVVPSLFNRLVIMETNQRSWHSVSPVLHDGHRCCVSNYYFSSLPPGGVDHFHVTSFSARPDQRLRRYMARLDTFVRMAIRKVMHHGLRRKDLYEPDRDRAAGRTIR